MKKITYYSIFISRTGKVETKKEDNQILKENKDYLCLDDFCFTTLHQPRPAKDCEYSSHSTLNNPTSHKRDWGRNYDDWQGYSASMYSDLPENKALSKLKSNLTATINNDLWFAKDALKHIDEAFKNLKEAKS